MPACARLGLPGTLRREEAALPTYEYRCDACGNVFEVFQRFSEAPVEACELCGGRVARVLYPVAIHFKGSGFYTTDYGRAAARKGSGGNGAATPTTETGGDGGISADGKGEVAQKAAAAGTSEAPEAERRTAE